MEFLRLFELVEAGKVKIELKILQQNCIYTVHLWCRAWCCVNPGAVRQNRIYKPSDDKVDLDLPVASSLPLHPQSLPIFCATARIHTI